MLNTLFSYGKQCLLFLYFMLLTSWTCKNYKERHYNTLLKTCLFFSIVSILVDSLSFSFEQEQHFRPVKVAVCPLQSPTYGVLHCLVIGIMLFSQHCIKDQTSGNMTVRDQDCRVGAVSLLFHN